MKKQLEMHRNNADALRDSYQTLEDKIDEIKRKKGILSVKQKQAEAQEKYLSNYGRSRRDFRYNGNDCTN